MFYGTNHCYWVKRFGVKFRTEVCHAMRYNQFGDTVHDSSRATPGFTLIVPFYASVQGMSIDAERS